MKKGKNGMKIMILLGIVLGGVGVGLFINSNFSISEFEFKIPVPDELSVVVNDINCRYRTTVYVIDSTGATVSSSSGNSQFGNPVYQSVVDVKTGKNTAGYVAIPKAGCDAQAGVVIDDSLLYITWEALDSNGNWKEIKKTSFKTKQTSFPANFGSGVKSLGSSSISTTTFVNDVEKALGSNNLESQFRIKVYGLLGVYWEGYESLKYYYQIDKEKSTVSGLNFRITNPQNVQDPDTKDSDGDGIIDVYDQCKTGKETYNGYKDSDGCPDSVPNNCSSNEDYVGGECVPKNSSDGDGSGEPDPIDTSEECDANFSEGDIIYIWSSELNECIPEESGAGGGSGGAGGGSPLIKNAYILVQPKYRDGTTQAFTLPLEGQAPLSVEFKAQNIVGSFDGSNKKAIVDLETAVYVDVGVTSFKVKSHTVTAKPSFRVAGTDVVLDEILYTGYSTSNAKVFNLPKTVSGGQVSFTGLNLGIASFRMSEVELNTPATLVPAGQVRDIDIRMDITGDIVLETNSGATLTGTLKDGLLNWSMEIARATSAQQQKCPDGENAVTVEGNIVCVPFGEDPPTTNQCTVGQSGCEICTSASNTGGFPCTKNYRDSYCGQAFGFSSANECSVPSKSDTENPNEQKIDSTCPVGKVCVQTKVDPTTGEPTKVTGGFPSLQQGSNPFAGAGGDLNSMAMLLGVIGIIGGIGLLIYKMRKK